jgi:hypothetical protein
LPSEPATGRSIDIVVLIESLADANGDVFLPNVHVGEPRHFRGQVKLVGALVEGAHPNPSGETCEANDLSTTVSLFRIVG